MPVPKSETTAPPRTLLRDVVYAKMLDAIQDGTLVPGERLNDDDLTAWLGVSRTPVREAIARLVSEGLVEMAANRYTRIASVSAERYADAANFLTGLHSLAIQSAGALDSATRQRVAKSAAGLEKQVRAQDLNALHALQDAYGGLVAANGNPLFIEAERGARGQAKFHAIAEDAHIDWDQQAADAAALANL